MQIITCPFCNWSAAYDVDDDKRRERFNNELEYHVREHLYDENI